MDPGVASWSARRSGPRFHRGRQARRDDVLDRTDEDGEELAESVRTTVVSGRATLRVFAGSPSGRLRVVPQHRKERNVHIASRNLCIRRPYGADHLGQASSARREWTGVEKTGRGTGCQVRAPDLRPKTALLNTCSNHTG
jgi:hypothetical protein